MTKSLASKAGVGSERIDVTGLGDAIPADLALCGFVVCSEVGVVVTLAVDVAVGVSNVATAAASDTVCCWVAGAVLDAWLGNKAVAASCSRYATRPAISLQSCMVSVYGSPIGALVACA